jgi:regulator of protease activity HflC (stomatin/prohibitin superfamily)
MVSKAIAEGNSQAINYFVANNYVKALEALAKAPNQKVIMMPLEASSVIGSIAGLAEITGQAFAKDGGSSTSSRSSTVPSAGK